VYSTKKKDELVGIRVDTSGTIDHSLSLKIPNNSNLSEAMFHIKSLTKKVDDTILMEEINGEKYIKSIRNKNIFLIYDFKEYNIRL